MTKADLEKRLADLQRDKTQQIANVHALGGAIQLLDQLIAEFDAEQKSAPQSTVTAFPAAVGIGGTHES